MQTKLAYHTYPCVPYKWQIVYHRPVSPPEGTKS